MRVVFQQLSLSQKILLGLVPLFLAFVTAGVIVQNHFQERAMLEEAQTAAHTYADIVRESLVNMMVNNLAVDSTFLDRVNALAQIDTLRIFVNDLRLRDELMTDAREARLRRKYQTLRPHDALDRQVLASGQPVFQREGNSFRGIIPFNATAVCQRCHTVPVGYTLGATDLNISLARVAVAADGNWKRSALIFFIFTGVMIAVAGVLFRRFISRPVDRLVAATRAISEGNLDGAIVPSAGAPADELAVLAVRFDDMRASLREKIQQLDQANRSLAERNEQMQEALAQLRAAQEELVRSERLAATGRLMAQLSHEINNPIHNIQSLLQSSLRRLPAEERTRELMEVALEEVVRLARLTRQMLDFSRGSVPLVEREPVDMGALLGEVSRMYEGWLRDDGITVGTSCAGSLPRVRGSRDRLKQVLINLVINARDAIRAARERGAAGREGRVTLGAEGRAGHVVVRVSDNGAGIPPALRDRIFDAFFTTKNEVSGVGLGLSVTYEIVQQHGGTISLESREGEGTTFIIILPAEDHDTALSA